MFLLNEMFVVYSFVAEGYIQFDFDYEIAGNISLCSGTMSVIITGPLQSFPSQLIDSEKVADEKLVVPGAKVSSALNFMR